MRARAKHRLSGGSVQALAVDGGTPVRNTPWPAWPQLGEAEIAAATSVLRSGKLSYWTGQEGRTLEREYADVLGRRYSIAVMNGTLALELALRALEVGAGDEVVIPARSFIATASCVVAVGATPIVADIEPLSGNLTAETVAAALTPRTKAVIAVHLGGWPVDMDPLVALASEHDFAIVEDCAQAHGATYGGRPLGSIGDAAAFSFCQDKIVTTGEGGLLALDDQDAYVRAWEYKDHGKSLAKLCDPDFLGHLTAFKWIHDSFGSNFRLPEVEASMARTQLATLPQAHARRTHNALHLVRELSTTRGLTFPLPPEGSEHAFYRLYAHTVSEELAAGWNRDRITAAIAAEGVPCQYGSCAELYREAAFTHAGLGPKNRLPGASRAHETSLAFFVHPTVTDADLDDAVAAVRKVMAVAAR
jgi:dTDP-4-amino-4,6-dideoxygalactose transaminase